MQTFLETVNQFCTLNSLKCLLQFFLANFVYIFLFCKAFTFAIKCFC